MSLFDSLNLSVATKYGNLSVAGGKVGFAAGGGAITPPTPTPLTPATPNGAGIGAWITANKGKAAGLAAAALVGLYLIFRRKA